VCSMSTREIDAEALHYTKSMLRYIRGIHPTVYTEASDYISSIGGEIIDIEIGGAK
jgi:hypothetical protein